MSKTKYLIYRILFPNGKSYVGWTNKGLDKRRDEHWRTAHYKKRRYAVHLAMLKYGFENLKWEVLYESDDEEFSLNIMEPYCIGEYQSHESKNGYNLTWGGDAPGLGVIQSEITKKKRSLALKGRKVGAALGYIYSEEEKVAISVRQTGKKNSFYGKTHSEEFKNKQSENLKRNPRPRDPKTGRLLPKSSN